MIDGDEPMTEQQNTVKLDVERRLKPGPDFDPVNLMTQIFDDAPSFMGPAEDILLSWLMRLSPGVDQVAAAQSVLDTIVSDLGADASAESRKLVELLRQSSHQTSSPVSTKQRRGGRASRQST